MITTALTLLAVLFLLELLFTAGCSAVLLLRRSDAPPCGRIMRWLWIAVLLLSLIPLRLFPAGTAVTVYENAPDDVVRIQIIEQESSADGEEITASAADVSAEEPAHRAQPITIRLPSRSADGIRILLTVLVSVQIIGITVSVIGVVSERVRAASLLRRHSLPCTDGRILALLRRCAEQMHMNNPPPLRFFARGIILSPCCSGVFRPTVYVSEAQKAMSDEALELILMHELSHVRARDTLLSVLVSAACAVHWMNPLCERVRCAVAEDCELGCDEAVLRICGTDSRVPYIHAILDIASGITAHAAASGSFYAVRGTQAEFIKRRYDSMKNTKSRRLTTALAAVMTGILLLGNVLAMSSCAFPTAASDSPAVTLQNPVLATALAEYFGLASAAELTEYHMSQITSLEISPSKIDGIAASGEPLGFVPVRIRVNGGVIPTTAGNFSAVVGNYPMFADGYVFEALPILLDRAALDNIADTILAAENGEWNRNKVLAFYCLKDASAEALYAIAYDQLVRQFCEPSAAASTETVLDVNGDGSIDVKDIELIGSKRTYEEAEAVAAALPAEVREEYIKTFTEQAKAELLALYPFAEARPMYVLDPETKPREASSLIAILYAAGALENRVLDSAVFDLADTALMPNLSTITVSEELTAVNMPK